MSSETHFDDLDLLIERLRDDDLSEAEQEELAARLKRDSKARQRFSQQMALAAALHQRVASSQDKVVPFSRATTGRGQGWKRLTLGIAAAIALLAGSWAMFQAAMRPEPAKSEVLVAVQNVGGQALFDGGSIRGGDEFPAGRVELESGATLDLLFRNGAAVLLEGPAELTIENDLQVTLRRGQLAARIPEAAHGFTVLGPDAAVVDLGTEFSMAVDGDQSWVEVYEGEVDIVLLNPEGHAWKNHSLTPSGPVRVDPAEGRVVNEAPVVELPRFVELPSQGLMVPESYRESVNADGAVHYWQFESEDGGGEIMDRIGNAGGTIEGGLRLMKDALHFPHGKRNHGAVAIREPAGSLLDGEFTLELWASPSFLQMATIIEVSHGEPVSRFREKLYRLSLVPSRPGSVYPPGTVRFLADLWPHGESGTVSVFSDERYQPGKWHHIVAVRRARELQIYLNGQPSQSVTVPELGDEHLPVEIAIGKMGESKVGGSKSDRSHFKGLLDEVAVYPTALPAETIAEHYRLMTGAR